MEWDDTIENVSLIAVFGELEDVNQGFISKIIKEPTEDLEAKRKLDEKIAKIDLVVRTER